MQVQATAKTITPASAYENPNNTMLLLSFTSVTSFTGTMNTVGLAVSGVGLTDGVDVVGEGVGPKEVGNPII